MYMGIDICKAWLDVCIDESIECRVTNNDAGITKICRLAREHKVKKILLEATGGYERELLNRLCLQPVPVARINPRQARRLAQGLGFLAKTDRIDARHLAYMAKIHKGPLYTAPPPALEELKALLKRRDELINHRTQESNRLAQKASKAVKRSTKSHLTWIAKELIKIEQALDALDLDNPELHGEIELLCEQKGVKQQTARSLVAEIPELGHVNRQQIAALVGLAPYNCDSGAQRGQRHIYGGRAVPRKSLYMAAFTARQHDPELKEFFNTLMMNKGKPYKVAMTAVMRKLLVRLNARLRDYRLEQAQLAEANV